MKTIQWLHFPVVVKWYITSLCNLRCSHCYLTDYTKQSRLDKIIRFIDYFGIKGVRSIILLGGEPLIRKDLEIIIQHIRKYNIDVNIATNGILATLERAKSLVAAGADKFQISIEGHNPELNDPVRGENSFFKIIEGATNLKLAGAHVTLSATISKRNYMHVERLHALARTLNVDVFRLTAFSPVGTGLKNSEQFSLDREIVLEVRQTLLSLKEKFPNQRINSVFLEQTFKSNLNCSYTFGCGAGTTNIIINSDFTVSACDLLVEQDKTRIKVEEPEHLDHFWKTDDIFKKWRGLELPAAGPLKTFEGVHQHGCQVNFSSYEKDLFQ